MSANEFGRNQKILDLLVNPRKREEQQKEPEVVKETLPVLVEGEQFSKESNRNVVKLSGIAISDTGQLSKTKYFEMLHLTDDQYADIEFTPEQAKRVSMAMKFLSTGLTASIPLTCTGKSCPFANSCPYEQIGKAPVGRPCPVEKQLISHWTEGYMAEFDVNFNSLTEVRMVAELAEFDIYEMRVTKYLAENHPTLMQDVIMGFDDDGKPFKNTEVSRAFDLKERIQKNRHKVLEALVATRKDKIKILAETGSGGSTAEKLNELKKKIESVTKDVQKMTYIDADVITVNKR